MPRRPFGRRVIEEVVEQVLLHRLDIETSPISEAIAPTEFGSTSLMACALEMRDLMVSEASASTTEMRAALIRETTALLKIGNVRLFERHALGAGVRLRRMLEMARMGEVHQAARFGRP